MFPRRISNDLSLDLGSGGAVADAKGKGESRVLGLFYPCLFSLMIKDLRSDRGGFMPSRSTGMRASEGLRRIFGGPVVRPPRDIRRAGGVPPWARWPRAGSALPQDFWQASGFPVGSSQRFSHGLDRPGPRRDSEGGLAAAHASTSFGGRIDGDLSFNKVWREDRRWSIPRPRPSRRSRDDPPMTGTGVL